MATSDEPKLSPKTGPKTEDNSASSNWTKFVWKIPNFSLTGDPIKSQIFSIGHMSVYLCVNPNYETSRQRFVSLRLKQQSPDPDAGSGGEVTTRIWLSILDTVGLTVQEKQYGRVRDNISIIDDYFIHHDHFGTPKNCGLKDGEALTIFMTAQIDDKPDPDLGVDWTASSSVVTDLASSLTVGLLSDVTILCRGSRFAVHKVILASRSSVFRAMFTSNMEESKPNPEIVMEDLEKEAVRLMVKFIYTNSIQTADLDENAKILLAAAEKYDLRQLKSLCENSLAKSLAPENCVRRLALADRFSAEHLKSRVLEFMTNSLPMGRANEDELSAVLSKELLLELLLARMNPSTTQLSNL